MECVGRGRNKAAIVQEEEDKKETKVTSLREINKMEEEGKDRRD